MERIVSENNPRVKRLVQLETKGRARREEGAFVVEGIRIFQDTPDDMIRETYVSASLAEELGLVQEQTHRGPAEGTDPEGRTLHAAGCPDAGSGAVKADRRGALAGKLQAHNAIVLEDPVFRKAADTRTPQGILAVVRQPSWTMADVLGTGEPLILITEHVQDPGNLGTMFRTAEAAGATGIIMTGDTVDLFQPKTVRATMSAIFRVPFLITEDLQNTLWELRSYGVRSYAAALDGKNAYDAADYAGGTAFLIGNEGNGLRPETAAAADEKIRIPMEGSIESLNAAMSAGILLYEAHRQRYGTIRKETV